MSYCAALQDFLKQIHFSKLRQFQKLKSQKKNKFKFFTVRGKEDLLKSTSATLIIIKIFNGGKPNLVYFFIANFAQAVKTANGLKVIWFKASL